MRRRCRDSCPESFLVAAGEQGSLLIELLGVLLLVALLLVPLAEAVLAATARTGRLGERVPGLYAGTRNGPPVALWADGSLASPEAWLWGGPLVRAEWEAGGRLLLEAVSPGCREGAVAGVWLEGHLLGEFPMESDGGVEVEVDQLRAGPAGAEVVARLRSIDGAWGPPWRTTVPGQAPPPPAAVDVTAAGAVAHLAGAGPASLELTSPTGHVLVPGSDTPVRLTLDGVGGVSVSGPSGVQSWQGEEAREVHLYF